ncbi:MAG: DUF6351 family protein [Burkholderiales bacterium]
MKFANQIVTALFLGLSTLAPPAYAHFAHDEVGRYDDFGRHHAYGRHHGGDDYSIEVLSGRADAITGGDALVRVKEIKKKAAQGHLRIKLNGADVTNAFVFNGASGDLTGLVSGMRVGENLLEVFDRQGNHWGKGRADADIVLTNYPIEGPVFSGPHEQPYACATQQFNLPGGLGNLGAPLDADCSITRRVDYLYKSTGNSGNNLTPWPAGATSYPGDIVMTATGKPYIVRLETGTVNRAIYQIAMLHDPIAQPAAPSWSDQSATWNKRLIYTFGGGCIGGWYRQGSSTGGVTDDFMLSNGYALASSSLNVFGNNCNDLTAAESMMMVKERFIEAFGPPAHTQGWGCSGGSYAQHQISDNYPGLLDGIIPGCSFPEVGFATIHMITDGWLLDTYFNANQAAMGWTDEQKRLVTGFGVYNTAPNIAIGARRIDPKPGSTSCAAVPVAERYDPATNPLGVRCTVYDHTVNVYGVDPATGFARRPLDNVGIQYGLRLLNDGTISVEQFLDLNEKIGGFDKDATIVPQRSVADLTAARAAYRTGRLTNGGGGLSQIPIIDYRGYNDEVPNGDIHVRYHSFSMRERLDKANGRHDNQIMLHEDNRYGLYSNASPLLQRAILTMDRWITAIKADKRHIPQIEKVVQNKPSDLKEGCNTRDAVPTFIAEGQKREQVATTACGTLYPTNSFPREVAGANVAADIIKCQTRKLKKSSYAVSFTPTQWARMEAIFPEGVCDWSKRGLEQQDLQGTWVFFD